MKVSLECFPCFVKQAVIAAKFGTADESLRTSVVQGVFEIIRRTDVTLSPAHATTLLHRRIRELLGGDPFKEIKAEYNRVAEGLYPRLSDLVEKSENPLATAARLAIAGNIIDFGIATSFDISATIEKALAEPLAVDDFLSFSDAARRHGEVFYLLDNAGEIVFDRLLIRVLQNRGIRVVAVVKGEPVLNDATRQDAVDTGLDTLCEVIDNGSDCVGTILELTSPDFRRRFDEAVFIISKGQGNFETLGRVNQQAAGKDLYFFFQSKCDVLSSHLGVPTGAMLLKKG